MSQYIFVYGTLLPELVPPKMAKAVGQLKLVGAATVGGQLYDLGNYPGVILRGEKRVFGRLFDLPPGLLKVLDAYEGFTRDRMESSEFVRRKCRATSEDGRRISGWVYEYNREVDPAKLIVGGDYLEFKTDSSRLRS